MGCVLLFLKQSLKWLLCREGRAVPSHTECALPDFKMRTFAFIPKPRKLVWDLENFGLSHVIRNFPMLPDLEVKLFWAHVLVWGQWHLVWALRSSLFSLYPLKACKLWKGKIRCWKCDFVVTANPHYLLLAMVWGSTTSFFISSGFAIFMPKATSSILAGLKICLTKPCCSFFGVNYCHGVTEEASSEAGNTLLIFVLLLYVHPCIQIRRGKVLCVSPAPQSTSAAPLLMRSPSGFSGTFVWVPMRDHGVNLLILKSKKCWEIYG